MKDFVERRGVYVISVVAELMGMHPQTLRIYERKGLVFPSRTEGGSRRYSEEDLNTLRKIQELANNGINLEGIKKIMSLEREIERLRGQLEELKERYQELLNQSKVYKYEIVPFNNPIAISIAPFSTQVNQKEVNDAN